MKILLAAATTVAALAGMPAAAQISLDIKTLTGDTRLACEALLCLAASNRPGECAKAISRYFSITATRPDKLFTKRLNFLNLCPAASASAEMSDYARILARGIGSCDADYINRVNRGTNPGPRGDETIILDTLPPDCRLLYSHQFIQSPAPRYVGIPAYGGYWVEPDQYASSFEQWKQGYIARCAEETFQSRCVQALDALPQE